MHTCTTLTLTLARTTSFTIACGHLHTLTPTLTLYWHLPWHGHLHLLSHSHTPLRLHLHLQLRLLYTSYKHTKTNTTETPNAWAHAHWAVHSQQKTLERVLCGRRDATLVPPRLAFWMVGMSPVAGTTLTLRLCESLWQEKERWVLECNIVEDTGQSEICQACWNI